MLPSENFVERPYGGSAYDESCDYDKYPMRRPWTSQEIADPSEWYRNQRISPPVFKQLVPPSINITKKSPFSPTIFPIFSPECPPAKTTRSNTLKFRSGELVREVSSLLNDVRATEGAVNKLAIIDIIYMIFKDNMDVLKNNTILYNVSKQKLNAIIDEYPEAQYLKAIRYQLFTV